MVITEKWAEQRVLMRAFAESRDQTRPTITLYGVELAIGPAGTDVNGPWGVHVGEQTEGAAQTIQGVVSNVSTAVTVVGALVLLSGVLILIGAVSMTKFRRVYEAAILKTLGATSRLIATMLVLEYGVLGAIAGTVGALGAIALSWGVARYALDLPWDPTPMITIVGIVATAILVAMIGVLASFDVLRNKPLSTLRAE